MYNVPSFTLARTIGGLVSWYWRQHLKREDTPIIIVASVSSHIPNHSPPPYPRPILRPLRELTTVHRVLYWEKGF